MADHREQPPCEVLHANGKRPCPTQAGSEGLGSADLRHCAHSQSLSRGVVMTFLRQLVSDVRALIWKARTERDLDEELREYLNAAIEQKMSRGMTREDATRAARAEMGSVESVKDNVRDAGW